MKTIKVTDGDLAFNNGDFVTIEGPEEIKQSLEIVLGTNKEEWFLNPEMGIDFSRLLDKSSERQSRSEIIQGIGQEPMIDTVERITVTSDVVNRIRHIQFEAKTFDGERIEGEVITDA